MPCGGLCGRTSHSLESFSSVSTGRATSSVTAARTSPARAGGRPVECGRYRGSTAIRAVFAPSAQSDVRSLPLTSLSSLRSRASAAQARGACSTSKWPDWIHEYNVFRTVLCFSEIHSESATRFIACNFTRNSGATRLRIAARCLIQGYNLGVPTVISRINSHIIECELISVFT